MEILEPMKKFSDFNGFTLRPYSTLKPRKRFKSYHDIRLYLLENVFSGMITIEAQRAIVQTFTVIVILIQYNTV